MSVFTTVYRPELEALLKHYPIGVLEGFAGIPSGTTNSNYKVWTKQPSQCFVLTLFEAQSSADSLYQMTLIEHLSASGIPCARPLRTRNKQVLHTLHDKPTALLHWLPGSSRTQPNRQDCQCIGQLLGRFHQQAQSLSQRRPNPHGLSWWQHSAARLHGLLSQALTGLIDDEIKQQKEQCIALPQGHIHADLFRDNVLFNADAVSGIIDFDHACHGALLYDVAVAVNDWCRDEEGLDPRRSQALTQAYAKERPWHDSEQQHWPWMLRGAALRFLLLRLLGRHFPRPGIMTERKDPQEFERLLRQLRQQAPALAS